jgi:hypothetical protein
MCADFDQIARRQRNGLRFGERAMTSACATILAGPRAQPLEYIFALPWSQRVAASSIERYIYGGVASATVRQRSRPDAGRTPRDRNERRRPLPRVAMAGDRDLEL